MKFEWDIAKATANLRKHGVTFEAAAQAFEDELSATFRDPDHSRGEARLITYGLGDDGRLLVVSQFRTRRHNPDYQRSSGNQQRKKTL